MRTATSWTCLVLATLLPLAAPSPARAAEQWISCTPIQVATYANRVHVRCSTGLNGITFFAIPTARGTDEAAFASRAIVVADAALVAGRRLSILYDFADQSGAAFGCQVADCRVARAVAIEAQ
jgi:hypothetical protein